MNMRITTNASRFVTVDDLAIYVEQAGLARTCC
jgi:hypothetical protein